MQLFCVNVSSLTETHFRWVVFSVEICAKCGYMDPHDPSPGPEGERNMPEAKRAESSLNCAQEQPLHVQ